MGSRRFAPVPIRMLTVDVEPDWGVYGDRAVRVVLPRLLAVLEERSLPATFFVVGDLLDLAYPLIRGSRMQHEVASHGLTHSRLDRISPRAAEREINESRRKLLDCGEPAAGFRAPFFAVRSDFNRILRKAGYGYDSSQGRPYPSGRNVPPRRWSVRRQNGLYEIPPTTLADGITPFSLTYLRLFGRTGRALIDSRAAIFYMHLHEFLPPDSAGVLPLPLRLLLRRNAGDAAWMLLERLLDDWRGRYVSCAACLSASVE